MASFEEIDEARRLFGLDESATLKEIKEAYRRLAHKYHPDKYGSPEEKEKNEEIFKSVSRAHDILMQYLAGYRYSFKKEDVKLNDPQTEYDEHIKRFYDGWWDETEG